MAAALPRWTVYARYNYDYQGEYRLRVTLADPPLLMESESNNNAASADVPVFTVAAEGVLTSTRAV